MFDNFDKLLVTVVITVPATTSGSKSSATRAFSDS